MFYRGTKIGKEGPDLAAKIGPTRLILAAKVVWVNQFWQFFAKIGPAGLILGGTDFGVRGQSTTWYIYARQLVR